LTSSADANLRFDGQIPPFLYPDDHFGPDLVFLLRNKSFKEFYPVLCQVKFSNNVDQPHALRTIVPELLYFQNRDPGVKKSKPKPTISASLSVEQLEAWTMARSGLLQCDATGKKRRQGVIRFMVQYPSKSTRSARPGTVAVGEYAVCEKPCTHKCHLDGLVTIDGANAGTLFGDNGDVTLEFLQRVKKKRIFE
jgi:hypothetical protein